MSGELKINVSVEFTEMSRVMSRIEKRFYEIEDMSEDFEFSTDEWIEVMMKMIKLKKVKSDIKSEIKFIVEMPEADWLMDADRFISEVKKEILINRNKKLDLKGKA